MGVWWTRLTTANTVLVRRFVAMVYHQVPNVWDPSKSVGENKHRITPVNSVAKQQAGAKQAEPPKR